MAIPQSKYVDITSGIGGGAQASRKDLIGRLFTTNTLCPTNIVLEFTSASEVSSYFGSSSQETLVANEYFGWISKSITKAKKISFFRYSLTATAPYIRSTQSLTALATLKAITDGSAQISMGGVIYELTSLDFSSATSYADIASTLQTAIQANTAGGTLWTSATVSYNATYSSFVLTGGETGTNTIDYAIAGSSGTDISSLIGWSLSSGAVVSNGTDATTLNDVLNKTIDISTNFATFGFLTTLSESDISTIGTWVDNQNMQYMFCGDVSSSNYNDYITVAKTHSGMAMNYNINYGISGTLPAFLMPMIALACVDYSKNNSAINYMYQQFPNQPASVDSSPLYKTLDGLNINYNGQTQKSGALLNFYQDGNLADGTDIGVYCNEIWLKDAMSTELINLLLALNMINADPTGEATIKTILQNVILEALNNGTISVGKNFDNTQKSYIASLTGDSDSWKTLQQLGYILSTNITTETVGAKKKYIGEYQLIYSKGDSIKKIEGQHVLI